MKTAVVRASLLAVSLLVLAAPATSRAETDRITVEDASNNIKFKVTSDGNVTGASITVKDATGKQKVEARADGTLILNSVTMDAPSYTKLYAVNENQNAGLTFDSYGNSTVFGAGGSFRFARGSQATKLAPQNGDRLGFFVFSGFDGSAFVNSAAFSAKVDGAVSAGKVPTKFSIETGSPARVERMVITSSGDVGIGATAPAQKLEINGGVRLNTAAAKPACDATSRGTFWVTQGASNDLVEVCALVSNSLIWKALW